MERKLGATSQSERLIKGGKSSKLRVKREVRARSQGRGGTEADIVPFIQFSVKGQISH